MTQTYDPIHELLVLISAASNEGSCESMQNCQSRHCSHEKIMDVNEVSKGAKIRN